MTPMDQLAAGMVLATLEREFEAAHTAWIRTRTPEAWERREDKAKHVRGHCKAYHLIPAADVGDLRG